MMYSYDKNEIVGIMDRLPEDKKLDVDKTFESQRTSVNNHIIPVIQKSINKNIFSVADSIIKYIIHERHRHQRESLLNRKKGAEWNDADERRKHANSRRNDVRKKISLFISQLFIEIFII
jgi:hypothetical protein